MSLQLHGKNQMRIGLIQTLSVSEYRKCTADSSSCGEETLFCVFLCNNAQQRPSAAEIAAEITADIVAQHLSGIHAQGNTVELDLLRPEHVSTSERNGDSARYPRMLDCIRKSSHACADTADAVCLSDVLSDERLQAKSRRTFLVARTARIAASHTCLPRT